MVFAGDEFWMVHFSGTLRKNPTEFGIRMRVTPLGWQSQNMDENKLTRIPLGWSLLSTLCEEPAIAEKVLLLPLGLQLLLALARYLAQCRSPHKVYICRCLTKLITALRAMMYDRGSSHKVELRRVQAHTVAKQFAYSGRDAFHDVLTVMDELYKANAALAWGFSPFLHALVDLVRVARRTFPGFHGAGSEVESERDARNPWLYDTMFERKASDWYFADLLRAESLAQSMLLSAPLPSVHVLERAYKEISDLEVLRWCLKQPEICLKLQYQQADWNKTRSDWLRVVNTLENADQVSQLLIVLKRSLHPDAFHQDWTNTEEGKSWEPSVTAARTLPALARLYMIMERNLKWDGHEEALRAFDSTWASRRSDWLAAMGGIASMEAVEVATPAEALAYKWTRPMDEQFISYLDAFMNKFSRRLLSLTFRDVKPSRAELSAYPLLLNVPLPQLRVSEGPSCSVIIVPSDHGVACVSHRLDSLCCCC